MNILTLSKNLGNVRLDQLDEELYTKIITKGNSILPEGYQLASNMSGVDISELYARMSTDVKTSCLALILVEKRERDQLYSCIKTALEHTDMMQEHDNDIKDYTISMVAVLIMVVTLGMTGFYMATASFRGEIPDSEVLRTVASWIHRLTTIDVIR